jgi:PAS domain S-box-containing protein
MEDKVRILLVEDYPPDAELEILEIKKEIPCSEFLVVDTKNKFLEALDNFAPHVIVSDYMMPQFDGMTALKLTQERTPLLPFILCTGSMNEDTAVECMKRGATDYIIKEHMKRLGESIKNALEQRKMLIDKSIAEEKSKQYASGQAILLDTNTKLLLSKNLSEIYKIVFDAVSVLDLDSYILLISFDPLEKVHKIEYLRGFERYLKWLDKAFHMNQKSLRVPLSALTQEKLDTYNRGKLAIEPEGLYSLSVRSIPREIGKLIEKALRIKEIYSIGFTSEKESLGGLAILQKVSGSPKNSEVIEIIMKEASQAIQKYHLLQSLAQSNERFRIIQEYSPIGIATVDDKGFFIDSNTAYQEMFCLPPHFPLEKLNMFMMKNINSDLKKRLEQGEIVRIENTFLMTEMETFYHTKLDLEFFIKAIETDPANHTQEFIVQVMDITERKRVENLKNEFINMISHEIRTPLTSMAQSMSIMKKHYLQNLSGDQTNLIDMFLRNTTRLSKIMQDILDFQKLNSTKLDFNLKPDSVNEVIQHIMEEFKTFSINQDIVIITQLEENLPDVLIDRERLSQVLINLISNALKFTEKGKVTIKTKMDTQKNQVKVSIEDTGIGINQEELRHIFVPFYQAKKDMEHKTGGTGLGLSICQKILEGHRSDLLVLSVPGHGSTFFFYLPLVAGRDK